jgi:hypothetical protein
LTVRDSDHVSPGHGEPQHRPLAVTSVVIYATLILLAVTVPRGLVNWTKSFEPNVVQALSLRVADAIQTLSHTVGLDLPYLQGRALFLQATGKRDD